jgi:hypothetical protein
LQKWLRKPQSGILHSTLWHMVRVISNMDINIIKNKVGVDETPTFIVF